jgi:non-heme chloroperoxidase
VPLVLLAGMSATAHTFDEFSPSLTGHFRVLAITRRGFGASSQPESGYDLDALARDVHVVLDSLGIERAVLAGHSYGAVEALRLATLWPDRIASLVSLDGMLLVDIERFFQVMGEVPPPPAPGDPEHASVAAYGDYIARIYGVHLPEAEIRARWHVLPDGRVGEEVTPGWIPLRILQGTDATRLENLRTPLLGIRHVPSSAAALIPWYREMSPEDRERADATFPALEQLTADGWAPLTQLPGARIVDLLDANHHPYISHPREVLHAMRDFLLVSMPLPTTGNPAAAAPESDIVHVAPPTEVASRMPTDHTGRSKR